MPNLCAQTVRPRSSWRVGLP